MYYFKSRKLHNYVSEYLEFYMFPLYRIIFVSMLIWTNEIIDIEKYRICFSEFFVLYDIVISDQSWYCNIIILFRIFYPLFLFLSNGDLDLMHRLSHILILTNVELIHAFIVVLTNFEFKFQALLLWWVLWMASQN